MAQQSFNEQVERSIFNGIQHALVAGNYDAAYREKWAEISEGGYDRFCERYQVCEIIRELPSILRVILGIDNGTENQIVLDALYIETKVEF
jgi:hypothetical protein